MKIKGTSQKISDRLNQEGIKSIEQLSNFTPEQLSSKIKGLGPIKAEQLINKAKKALKPKIEIPLFEQEEGLQEEDVNKIQLNNSISHFKNEQSQDDTIFEEEYNLEDLNDGDSSINDDDINNVIEEFLTDNSANGNKELDDFLDEKLASHDKVKLEDNVRESLHKSGFTIISEKENLVSNIYEGIDALAIKSLEISKFLDIIIIIPIKICDLNGVLLVSEKGIDYKNSVSKIRVNDTIKDHLLGSDLSIINSIKKKIFNELVNEGNLFNYFIDYLKMNLEIEKTSTQRKLYFKANQYEIQIIIDPILISKNGSLSLERTLFFPYQKKENLHIINSEKLIELLEFLKDKYKLIEKFSDKELQKDKHFASLNIFYNRIKYASIPFLIVWMLNSIGLIFYFSTRFLITSILIILFYFISLSFLYYGYILKIKEIKTEFNTPYYQRVTEIGEPDLILIDEYFKSKKLLEQFGYECLGKQRSIALDNLLEKNQNYFFDEKLVQSKNLLQKAPEQINQEKNELEIKDLLNFEEDD